MVIYCNYQTEREMDNLIQKLIGLHQETAMAIKQIKQYRQNQQRQKRKQVALTQQEIQVREASSGQSNLVRRNARGNDEDDDQHNDATNVQIDHQEEKDELPSREEEKAQGQIQQNSNFLYQTHTQQKNSDNGSFFHENRSLPTFYEQHIQDQRIYRANQPLQSQPHQQFPFTIINPVPRPQYNSHQIENAIRSVPQLRYVIQNHTLICLQQNGSIYFREIVSDKTVKQFYIEKVFHKCQQFRTAGGQIAYELKFNFRNGYPSIIGLKNYFGNMMSNFSIINNDLKATIGFGDKLKRQSFYKVDPKNGDSAIQLTRTKSIPTHGNCIAKIGITQSRNNDYYFKVSKLLIKQSENKRKNAAAEKRIDSI